MFASFGICETLAAVRRLGRALFAIPTFWSFREGGTCLPAGRLAYSNYCSSQPTAYVEFRPVKKCAGGSRMQAATR